ncbi:CLUMA_CG016459, isoform A [Clunio marinus]|uniref:Carboxylic ester hydrolase n=1 Tax=Clunio marinus TaxID=568069 RepID=A0A1J1IUZ6_9DIPT|nr:CLUMA_CG016459, isoform A [Clunio marinus]
MDFVLADTEYGKIRGVKKLSKLDTEFIAFLGIPFATPPINDLRFKDPIPPSQWKNIYDGTKEKSSSVAYNFHLKEINGSEDCLYLNIYTKNLKPKEPQGVMVYIHGGGFVEGSNKIDVLGPDYLLMANVVVVTINYRLGALGFMSFIDETLKIPGNAAMKDQVMAMKFVKKNIENFGGNPNNITLFGHSSGGCSVSWHCVSEISKGLFNRAIIMSGCVLNKFALTPHKGWGIRLARKLGYEGNEEEKEVAKFLRQIDAVDIVKVQESLVTAEERDKISGAFAPHMERYISEQTFNSEFPINLVRKAWSNDIDVLIGGTSDEGLMFLEYVQKMPMLLKSQKLTNAIPFDIDLNVDDPIREEFADKLKSLYFSPDMDPTEDVMGFCRLKGDQSLWHGMQRLVQSRQHSNNMGKTFLYRFAVDSPTQNYYRITRLGPEVRGVCHADEISFLFKSVRLDVPLEDSMEFKTIKRFVSIFTSFATTGNPNDNIIKADMENIQWNPVETIDPPFKCLNIDEALTFEVFPESTRLKVWNEIYQKTNTPLY